MIIFLWREKVTESLSITVLTEIKGDHDIVLRPISDTDTNKIVAWRNQDFVRKNFIYRKDFTTESHKDWLETVIKAKKAIQYIIEYKSFPIGSIYIRDIDTCNKSGELGIFIGERGYQKKGLGTEVIKMFCLQCEQWGFHRIFLRVLEENQGAKRCYLNSGFQIEGIAKEMVRIDGEYKNILFMAKVFN